MTMFSTCLMFIAFFAGIYNAVAAYRVNNREATIAWGVATLFALALFLRNLADVTKSMT